jgi:hypothetical protein
MGGERSFAWKYEFTMGLLAALLALPGIDEPDRRKRLVALTEEQLGVQAGLAPFHNDTRLHLHAIVNACKSHQSPPNAVTALVAAAEFFSPHTAAVERLKDFDDEIHELTVVSAVRLYAVLVLLEQLHLTPENVNIQGITVRSLFPGENHPLRATEGIAQALRRLNGARQPASGRAPLLLRVLSVLADRIKATRADARLAELVTEIAVELGYPPDLAALLAAKLAPAVDLRVLRIKLEDDSGPGQTKYAIEGAVYAKTASGEELVARSPAPAVWSAGAGETPPHAEFADAGSQFLDGARNLTGAIGQVAQKRAEFVLPWPLLGYPVERWRIDGGTKWIGHLCPVVVRSLDRSATFFSFWQEKWALLTGQNGAAPVRDRIGWLHYGGGAVPPDAQHLNRVLPVDGQYGVITEWLTGAGCHQTIGFGLTFAYNDADPTCRQIVRDTFEEGIPMLLWRRDNGDAGALETLLAGVTVNDLPAHVMQWRRQTANNTPATADVRYHVVLLWDDPTSAVPPSAAFLAAPQHGG